MTIHRAFESGVERKSRWSNASCLVTVESGKSRDTISFVKLSCHNDIFELKKSVFVKNPGAHFTLKISAKQRFETYAVS